MVNLLKPIFKKFLFDILLSIEEFIIYSHMGKSQNLLKHIILCFLFIEETNHEEIVKKVDNLLKQMSVVSSQLQQLSDTVEKIVKCKSCQKKFYKVLNANNVSLEDVATRRKKAGEYHATPATPPANTISFFNASGPEKCKSYSHPEEHG